MNNSAKTAIARCKLSAPMSKLVETDSLKGEVLDYGCGRGFDADFLQIAGYDPYHRNVDLGTQLFDTITCNYVLNVIEEPNERQAVLDRIRNLLKVGGKAYISVRADKVALKGRTKIGTWQGFINLNLPIEHSKSNSYIMYRLDK